jgi:nucleoid-associated protein YgaU
LASPLAPPKAGAQSAEAGDAAQQHPVEAAKANDAAVSVTVVKPSAQALNASASAPTVKSEPQQTNVAATSEPETPQTAQGEAVVPEIRTAKIVPGDNLWDLSEHFYGWGPHYRTIYEANAAQIRNPALIYPDQIFVVPQKPTD